jgi:hypothetical protein
MKTKDQILWEERKQLEMLTSRKLLSLETDIIINSICVNYLITCRELQKKFAIIKSNDKYERDILESSGYRTLQTDFIDINQVEFLIDYIFRN